MIFIDNIVATLQRTGGISILFRELEQRLTRDKIAFTKISYDQTETSPGHIQTRPRPLERYRPCKLKHPKHTSIFHSTYYRIPAQKDNLRIITTVHDFTYEKFVGGLRKLVHSTQKNHAIKNSDAIICVSHNTRNDLLDLLPDITPEKIFVVHNGVSSGFYPAKERALKNQVLFVGQRGRYKNFLSVVKALSMLNEISISCVGGGPFTKEEFEILEKNIPGRYKHLGYIDECELNSQYNNSIALIYPSLYEGFGIPVIEAMRAGCPVIAVNSSSIPEVAGDAALLMERGTPDEIKSALEKLEQSEYREKLISLGISQAEKFSWERTYQETLSVYRQLLPNSI
ncbi:glycosyltransferase family 4 protein [Pseudomonas sp. BN417]|uniref:glycosyltransferase family 4 protein n=1 Tax=Pseudomonas sp. BN417 TaxID=2567890 RepID=UPI002455D0CF|nr:glycosyltransferase family 1 protein [Pseudomonas sp. BN417]MDH4558237.1 glycosyltransferase family 4 protein [Pseudomonas sp. BN417]